MIENRLAKVSVDRIAQVAVVAHDLPKVVAYYWSIMGIGPWNIYNWEDPAVYDRTYHGKPAWSKEMICHAMVGDLELEVMQPVEGPSLYGDFLNEHGEGVHHLQFLVDDLDEAVRVLTEEYGFPNLQGGSCGRTKKGCRYNYIYIEPLACIWELVECTEGIATSPNIRYPEDPQSNSSKVKVKKVPGVAIVVRDLDKVARSYQEILNIGPWTVSDWNESSISDRVYHGKPSRSREKIAVADVGGVKLELIQPLAGDSIYQDFLNEFGEGLHHIECHVDDVDMAAKVLTAEGFPSLESGRLGPDDSGGSYNYIEVKPLCAIWKLVHNA